MAQDTDLADVRRYTSRARLDKAVNTLNGILKGVNADQMINPAEIDRINVWLCEHAEFMTRHPFSEIFPMLVRCVEDSRISAEDYQDLLWLCDKLQLENPYYDEVTREIQTLQGILDGISSDGLITVDELVSLRDWTSAHQHLAQIWPFTEIDALITTTLSDGKISDDEHAILLKCFDDFSSRPNSRGLESVDRASGLAITGICAVAPSVLFENKIFCFTGKSRKYPRDILHTTVVDLGGQFKDDVSKHVDYLVVGAEGNLCWAFACYGRKVEKAVELRQSGHRLLMIHENDFWDAVSDYGYQIE